MKKVVIVYNQTLTEVQGINYVNNSFVEGQKYFNDKGFELTSIFAPDGVFECEGAEKLDLIGSNLGTTSYARERKLRSFLREILSSNYLLGASVKFYFNHIKNAKISIDRFLIRQDEYDYIIFQDIMTACYYLKYVPDGHRKKSILILHCSKEAFEQAKPAFPALFANSQWRHWIEKNTEFVFSNIDKVVYLSQRAVDYSPVAPEKKTCIFNGEEDLHVHEITEPHSPINMTCVGSMAWRKGQDFSIYAMAKLPKDIRKSYKLHLIGSGPQLQELKDLVNNLNLEEYVVFYGNRNDVPELLKQMDMFIMPSISEGLPMSIIEALRQGMYVIGTDTGAIPEMIAPGCGELVERDADKIAECLSKVVEEKKITHEMKVKAREHYLKHFTLKSMIYNYCDVLHSL